VQSQILREQWQMPLPLHHQQLQAGQHYQLQWQQQL
jgi:hypothetical protein